MKITHFAAAALLVGTSAFAFKPDYEPAAAGMSDSISLAQMTWAQHVAYESSANALETWANTAAGDPDLDLAVNPDATGAESIDLGRADTGATGVGGPEEPVPGAVAALDLTPRPATQNYPPCAPGPGDDNCIQLYEPGVETALANWTGPTGGLIDASGETQTAMGGPYEPAEAGADATAMVGDGEVVAALGETEADEATHLLAHQPSDYTGVGGPIAETGYPACSATVTDRCIQLYERGVTGEGN